MLFLIANDLDIFDSLTFSLRNYCYLEKLCESKYHRHFKRVSFKCVDKLLKIKLKSTMRFETLYNSLSCFKYKLGPINLMYSYRFIRTEFLLKCSDKFSM